MHRSDRNKCVDASVKHKGKRSPGKPRRRRKNDDYMLTTEHINLTSQLQIYIREVLFSNTDCGAYYPEWGLLWLFCPPG